MRDRLKELFLAFGQEHLINDIEAIDDPKIAQCINLIRQWSPHIMEQKASWQLRRPSIVFEPLAGCSQSYLQCVGPKPRIGVLILAGGQGSRLGISGPKGCFPLLGKSLFQRHSEKIGGQNTPLAIMTSSLNHTETVSFFENNDFFGLKDVSFFSQKTLPLFDDSGRWFWEESGCIAAGADGNGSVFQWFVQSGCWDRFMQKGVEAVHIINVDNPLADPFDPVFLSFHRSSAADLSVKSFWLNDPNEPTGRLVQHDSRLAIAEFAELSNEQRNENLLSNTGLLLIDIHLMGELANQTFPLHWARRTAVEWKDGDVRKINCWKAERFIVDALSYAERGKTICFPRGACYAPLKEKGSIPQIEQLLLKADNI